VVVPNELPSHLRTEVASWTEYFAAQGLDPTAVEYPDPERFVQDVLASKSLTVRLSCINAINEWYERFLSRPGPFRSNPWGYPLLTRFLPVTFSDAFAAVTGLPDPARGYAALVLVCRFSAKDLTEWGGTSDSLVRCGDRVVPITDTVRTWITPWVKPNLKQAKAAIASTGHSVTDLHGALFAELTARGVPEITRASLYGRWSAMRFENATHRVGFFRGPLPGSAQNPD
jgi:hypothetical protein